MTLQLINNELFFVEYDQGEKIVQEKFCNLVGHEIADHDTHGKNYTIKKGICLKCGEGTRYWKMTKKETEEYRREMEALR
jgi:hypothetical protein